VSIQFHCVPERQRSLAVVALASVTLYSEVAIFPEHSAACHAVSGAKRRALPAALSGRPRHASPTAAAAAAPPPRRRRAAAAAGSPLTAAFSRPEAAGRPSVCTGLPYVPYWWPARRSAVLVTQRPARVVLQRPARHTERWPACHVVLAATHAWCTGDPATRVSPLQVVTRNTDR
jgi:hypothetical protein